MSAPSVDASEDDRQLCRVHDLRCAAQLPDVPREHIGHVPDADIQGRDAGLGEIAHHPVEVVWLELSRDVLYDWMCAHFWARTLKSHTI